jgi:hypothetical protein
MFNARITGEDITLLDDDKELIYWHADEWIGDPSLVPAIANAIRLGYVGGAAAVKERLALGRNVTFRP